MSQSNEARLKALEYRCEQLEAEGDALRAVVMSLLYHQGLLVPQRLKGLSRNLEAMLAASGYRAPEQSGAPDLVAAELQTFERCINEQLLVRLSSLETARQIPFQSMTELAGGGKPQPARGRK